MRVNEKIKQTKMTNKQFEAKAATFIKNADSSAMNSDSWNRINVIGVLSHIRKCFVVIFNCSSENGTIIVKQNLELMGLFGGAMPFNGKNDHSSQL